MSAAAMACHEQDMERVTSKKLETGIRLMCTVSFMLSTSLDAVGFPAKLERTIN